LHDGENNTISLWAVGTNGKGVPDAGFSYDAIGLERSDSLRFEVTAPSVTVNPTVFYKQDSGLKELVTVRVRLRQPLKSGTVELTVNGAHYNKPLGNDRDFGEQECSFLVPEFAAHSNATIALHIDGRTFHFNREIEPRKKWTVFIVPHVHFDLGYTDYQAKVAAIQSRIIDEALDLIKQHPDFRFSMDGMWSLDQFLATRSGDDKVRAIDAIKNDQLFVPAQYSNELTGFPSAEALIRSLYPSANFSRRQGVPFNYANITDVPSYSWSYASVLASAGIHDLIAGSNNGRAPVLLRGHLDEESPFWWKGPDNQKVLFWYSRHYHQMWTLFGLPPHLSAGQEMLPVFLQMYDRPGYLSDSTIVYGSQVENTDLFPQQAELATQWNADFAYPRLEYSGFHAALEHIAGQFGSNMPTVSGDGGPYWEDGIASDARYVAMERRTESRGPSAEKIATITSLVDPRMAADKNSLDEMWRDIVLMDEHTWTASDATADPATDQVVEQLAVKDSHAIKADWSADRILRSGMANLANFIAAGPHSLVVFNMLNWTRSGLVEADVSNGEEFVEQTSGRRIEAEILRKGPNVNRMRFLAQGVPAVGYKVYQMRPAQGSQPSGTPKLLSEAASMENSFYRIDLDPNTGSVRNVFDKQLQRSLVDEQSPYRFGQYLYVTNHAATFDVHGAAQGRILSIARTPYGQVAHLESSTTNTPCIATDIRLFDSEKKIEFIADVDKKEVLDDEAAYFAFPFAMPHPRFRYEIQNGVVDPAKDMYPGAGVEWFTVQHWVSVDEDGASAAMLPLDAPLVTLGDITRLQFPKTFNAHKGWIFSYAMNNYWHTNYRPVQGGHFQFRYLVTSAATLNPSGLSRTGWEEVTPLEVNEITPSDKAVDRLEPLDGAVGSFLQADDPNLLLTAWKPAEDGNGTILRFLDLGGPERKAAVQIPFLNLNQAWRTNSVERNQEELPREGAHELTFTIHPHEIVTLRISGTPTISATR
jgi:hypothetical protein